MARALAKSLSEPARRSSNYGGYGRGNQHDLVPLQSAATIGSLRAEVFEKNREPSRTRGFESIPPML
jgi:hypothetical protein